MRKITCICCPKGCSLMVDEEKEYTVTGNGCKRGAEYGKQECLNPIRFVTSTVRVRGSSVKRCPVKTAGPVPKDKTLEVASALNDIIVEAPVKMHQLLLSNVAGTGADIIACKKID